MFGHGVLRWNHGDALVIAAVPVVGGERLDVGLVVSPLKSVAFVHNQAK